jgi:hypothetical protein
MNVDMEAHVLFPEQYKHKEHKINIYFWPQTRKWTNIYMTKIDNTLTINIRYHVA